MDNFYIFQYCENQSNKNDFRLVIFCSGLTVDSYVLKDKLREFFTSNPPPKKIYVIGGEYLNDTLNRTFNSKKNGILEVIPNYLILEDAVKILLFDINGKLTSNGGSMPEIDLLLKIGNFNIFTRHGGLIQAPSEAYHYVFPSGKHSTRFIRAGNVLVQGAEIAFIALSLLKFLKSSITHIYCDTSSINSLAYAVLELKNRFKTSYSPAIVSFGSYEKFESFNFQDSRNSLVIISASTSGRIAKRLREKQQNLKPENIIVLFYLSNDPIDYKVICDLTYHEREFPQGLMVDQTYENEVECNLCKGGSYTVKISGDIFLLEKPKINTLIINKNDAPEFLSRFMQKFHAQKGVNLIRCFYGEDEIRTFEIFFKVDNLIENTDRLRNNYLFQEEFGNKLNKILSQHVPAGLKTIIYLDDDGSKLISEKIAQTNKGNSPLLITSKEFTNLEHKGDNMTGAILIVCSCMVTGNNLLYINKYLRRFKKMTKTFLVIFSRTENEQSLDFVRKNIGQGEFGINTNHFIHVEKITCSQSTQRLNSKTFLTWSLEIDLLKRLIQLIEDEGKYTKAQRYIKARLDILEASSDRSIGGLTKEVFLRNPISNRSLKINKNFAFFDFDGYQNKASQADIYFTISTILNNLRNSSDSKKIRIIQEEQVRTLIDPGNFIRYDDGVIQASILRAATPDELNYKLSPKLSSVIAQILVKMADSYKDSITSEALIEFLFAFAIKHLRIDNIHLTRVLDAVDAQVTNPVILLFSRFIRLDLKLVSPQKRES